MEASAKQTIKAALNRYTSWGCYPAFLVTSDGAALCPDCVRSEIREIVDAVRRDDRSCGWHPMGAYVNWENPDLYCDHCSQRIESAYAEEE